MSYVEMVIQSTGDLITAATWNRMVGNLVALQQASLYGWKEDGETWVYASANTFTIADVDMTAVYLKGTRIRWKDGGAYKYAVVTDSAFVTDTTVTFTGGADYTMANATITDNYFSYDTAPQDYPSWFAYTPTISGYSANPTDVNYRFKVDGRTVTLHLDEVTDGTSNDSDRSYTLPITALVLTNNRWSAVSPLAINNGATVLNAVGQILYGAPTLLNCYTTAVGAGWTATGASKFAGVGFEISYEMA